ncbi:hypothetical protein AGMMS50225_24450 [Betaproteobacteria bacterium]|nr:hypothetical protein AGMMS50225_24450 [Betaproteobacteria bacterium]
MKPTDWSDIAANIHKMNITKRIRAPLITLCASGAIAACLSFAAHAQTPAPEPQPGTDQISDTAALEAAIERSAHNEKELLDRIRELEGTQASLLEAYKKQSARENAAPPVAPLDTTANTAAPQKPEPAPGAQTLPSDGLFTVGFVVLTLILAVVLLRRPRQNAPKPSIQLPALEPIALASVPPFGLSAPSTPAGDEPATALNLRNVAVFTPEAREPEHDSAIELAEIMLSFGRINSAAKTLANFIDRHPRAAITPWLKLLEVYRASGQRAEFDTTADKLNHTFNIDKVNWDNFDEATDPGRSLEQQPHIMERLETLWGRRECQAYLNQLLLDTRDDTRHGFPLMAIDDILLLDGVLEQQLGPYTGPPDPYPLFPADDQTEHTQPD